MANTIKLKQSSVAGKVPTTANLDLGELAVNTTDGKLYLKKNVSGTESVVEIGAGGGGSSTLTISDKTAAYTVVAGDLGTIINCTANTFTVSLTAAATLGAGFNVTIWNTSSTIANAITIDPSGAETIDGRATLVLRRGEGVQIVCNGTNWQTGSKKVMRGYAENLDSSDFRPTASGDSATAIGKAASASSSNGLAVGWGATASGTASTIALGALTTASISYGTAIGANSSGNGSQAVTGSGAMALGGSYASGTDSFAAAVASNSSSYGALHANSVVLGWQAKSTNTYAVALGAQAEAGQYACAIGQGALAQGRGSFAFGYGAKAVERNKFAFAGPWVNNVGDRQGGLLVLAASTTDASATLLRSDTSAAGTANQLILPNNSAYVFSGLIVARQQAAGGTASAAWKVEGLIRREGTAGSVVLVNSALTVIDNTSGWTVALSADTTNGGLAITVTGAAATNIRWVATVQTSELTYA